MANSSFYKNTGTSTQLQTTAASSAAAAAASQAAALVSQNAAATSETNAAASAAAALVSKNAAASSAASANSDASAASISATASQTAATSSSANAVLTSADATQTAADRVQTGLDRVATAADAVQTAADRVQTGLDVTSSSNSAAAALSSRNAAATSETNAAASASSSAADAASTAADVISTAADAASTAADVIATAADRVQTGLDVTAAGTSATNAATSASAAASDATAAAASAASAANSYDLFDDRYLGSKTGYATAQTGPALDNDGNALVAGTLFFSADANEMRVFDGAGWIAASSAGSASLINYHYTATAAQTTFSGSDDNSNTLSYTVDNLIVTKNGIVLEVGTDYTATNGTSIVLAVAAAAGDEINVVAFKSFTTADMVSATNGGAFQGNVDFAAGADVTGNITVTGTVDGRDVAADGTKLDGIEALADVTDTANVTAAGAAMLTGANFTGNVDVTGSVTADYLNITAADNAITSKIANTTGANYLQITNGTANGYFGTTGANTVSMLSIGTHPLTFGTDGGTERMRIDSTGNVGIGNVSPSSYYSNSNQLVVGSGAARQGITIASSTTTIGQLAFADGTSGDARYEGWVIYDHNTDHMSFATSASERMRIDSSGNVGIGTTSPDVLLDIEGASATQHINATSGNANTLYQLAGTTTGSIEVGGGNSVYLTANNASGNMYFRTGGPNTRMTIDSSGRVTMPYQPFALVDFNGSGYVSLSAGIVPFGNIAQNQGNHYNTSTYKFTCPVAGVYRVSAKFITSGASDVGHINLYKNNVRVFRSYTAYRGFSGDFTILCSANDILHLETDAVSVYQTTGTDTYSFASYYLLG